MKPAERTSRLRLHLNNFASGELGITASYVSQSLLFEVAVVPLRVLCCLCN